MSTTRSLFEATNCASSSRAAPIVPIRRLYTFHRSAWSSLATLCTTNAASTSATPTPESRKNWIAALDRLALNPGDCFAGHKKPGGRPSLDDPRHQALPAGLRSGAENRDVRPGAVRSDDGAIPALGSQSVVVDVRIPDAITHINADANVPRA